MYISIYNLCYTSLPVLALGVFEQDVSDKDSLDYPKLYTPGLTNALFNTKEFILSVVHGTFSSLILFLVPYYTYYDGVTSNGLVLSDHMTLASVIATILILDNTAQVMKNSHASIPSVRGIIEFCIFFRFFSFLLTDCS